MELNYEALAKRLGQMLLAQWQLEDQVVALKTAASAAAPVTAQSNGVPTPAAV